MSEIDAPFCASADLAPQAAGFRPSAGACDWHAHVSSADFEFLPSWKHKQPLASLSDYEAMLSTPGIDHEVIVPLSVFGTDNRATVAPFWTGRSNGSPTQRSGFAFFETTQTTFTAYKPRQ